MQIKIPNSSIVFDNPQQIDQSTLNWQSGIILTGFTDPSWVGVRYGYSMAFPKPGSYDATPPEANPVLFGKQPPSLSAGGIQIPNTSVVLKNPS